MPTTEPICPYIATDAEYRPDRYYRYAELTRLLETWAAAHPELATLGSIGRTYEGREIWCMTLTNAATGPHDAKPGYMIDGNLHAGEVAGSAVCLYTIRMLLDGHGHDAFLTRLLDDFSFYVLPRVSADGAELYLCGAETARSSVRPYPETEPAEGLRAEDVDGDGWIATMRIPDPNGPWKVSAHDPRLMVRRTPDESGGEYYWVLSEGRLSDHDPEALVGEIKPARRLWGLDLNRNFPIDWEPEALTAGAGPYPLSEPETRALAEFMIARRNLAGSQHYHTFSAVILRASSRRPDEDLPRPDLARIKAIGQLGTEETGYPLISLYHDFTIDRKRLYAGMLIDWVYDHRGLISYSTELWNLGREAGVGADKPIAFYFGEGRTEADELAMLRWVDAHMDGFGFLPWKPFDHPQLGRVEIGGWQTKFTFQNPPGPMLEALCRQNAMFTLRAAAASPRLRVREATATPLGAGLYRVQAVVENQGFLPTQVTERAIAMQVVKPDRLAIAGPELVSGEPELELGFVPGRSSQYEPFAVFPHYGLPTRRRAEWIVRGEPGQVVTLEAISERGGRHARELVLS